MYIFGESLAKAGVGALMCKSDCLDAPACT